MCSYGTTNLSPKILAKKGNSPDCFWVAVKVERGFPTEVRAFYTEEMATKQETAWRRGMNFDYNDTGVFQTALSGHTTGHPAELS